MRKTYRVNYIETDGSYNSKLLEADKAAEAVEYVENLETCQQIYLVELVTE